MLHISFIPVSS